MVVNISVKSSSNEHLCSELPRIVSIDNNLAILQEKVNVMADDVNACHSKVTSDLQYSFNQINILSIRVESTDKEVIKVESKVNSAQSEIVRLEALLKEDALCLTSKIQGCEVEINQNKITTDSLTISLQDAQTAIEGNHLLVQNLEKNVEWLDIKHDGKNAELFNQVKEAQNNIAEMDNKIKVYEKYLKVAGAVVGVQAILLIISLFI